MKRITHLVWLLLLLPLAAHATVTSQAISVSFTCTGASGPFPFTFSISAASALTVTQNGTVLNSGLYSIAPVNNNYNNGGSVTLNTPCPSGQPLVLTRVTPLTQTTVFTNNMPIPMTSIMNGLDKLTEALQESDAVLNTRSGIGDCPGGEAVIGLTITLPICAPLPSGSGGAPAPPQYAVQIAGPGALALAANSQITESLTQPISCWGGCPTNPTTTVTGAAITAPVINGVYSVNSTTAGSIQTVINTAEGSGGGIILIPPGAYTETNLTITTSQIILQGSGRQTTTINVTGTCGLTLSAGTSGNGINYNGVRDLSIVGPGTTGSTDGICFTGGANIPNDRTTIERVGVNTTRYGLNIEGRAIWDRFVDDYFENNYYGVYTNTAAAINDDIFEGGRIGGNVEGGLYWINTNSNVAINISLDKENVEYNGTGSAIANCAGAYLNGIAVGSIKNSYFEGNCTLSTGASNGADIRLDGSYVESFDIQDSNLWSATSYGILNSAAQTSGDYHGNRIIFQTTNPILVEGNSIYSNVTFGNNYLNGGVPQALSDSNANFHLSGIAPFTGAVGGAGIAGNTINPVSGGVLNPLVYDTVVIYNGPFTITNMGDQVPGRIVTLASASGTSNVLSSAGTGATAMVLKGGASTETLPAGDTATFQYNPNLGASGAWIELYSGSNYTTGTLTVGSESGQSGFAACYSTAGKLGHCTSVVSSSGGCTCATP